MPKRQQSRKTIASHSLVPRANNLTITAASSSPDALRLVVLISEYLDIILLLPLAFINLCSLSPIRYLLYFCRSITFRDGHIMQYIETEWVMVNLDDTNIHGFSVYAFMPGV